VRLEVEPELADEVERYMRGHNRFCKRIFFINGVDIATTDDATAEDAPDAEALVFSLHAVAGVPICNTI